MNRISWHVKPDEFQAIMLGLKKQLVLEEPAAVGDIVQVGLNDRGTGTPYIECNITHVEILRLAKPCFDSELEEITEKESQLFIASIQRGLEW